MERKGQILTSLRVNRQGNTRTGGSTQRYAIVQGDTWSRGVTCPAVVI